MKQRCIVLSAVPYSFTDEHSGGVKEGISLSYVMTDSLVPIKNQDFSRGYKPVKGSLSIEKKDSIKEVPGVYDMSFVLKSVRGKPELKLDGLTFVSSVK